ncbi:RNA polymerase subunit sigma-70 [Mycolicibacterium sp. CH28]|uniref:SatD family protein n=1 Tax=Mycolicibacterium sp. CH28 TaxID=2512237 RepID=UPI001080F991|nr:SatD family protein [Mycolicibacterium sp. CH28]TGD86081.1 RNA polymerase subunit sigma-70 [Mycolicibacterium sp. CH28]
MGDVKAGASSLRAALIGDVVGSRHVSDRRDLHHRVSRALAEVAAGSPDPPAFTVGDEFQGSYPAVGAAIDAALSVRLALAPDVDVRFGIGWGEVTVLDTTTGIQDGPGWWSARAAIEWTAGAQRQPGLTHVRTAYRRADTEGPDPDTVNAALLCRDHLLGSVDARSLRLLRGLLEHKTKKELAAMEGISASAVSQRTARDGLDLLVLASRHLRAIR